MTLVPIDGTRHRVHEGIVYERAPAPALSTDRLTITETWTRVGTIHAVAEKDEHGEDARRPMVRVDAP